MFDGSSKFVEASTGEVIVKDIERDVFEDLLRFIYTDEAPDMKKHPECLLIAADRYNVSRLKSLCEHEIADGLSVENAPRILLFADMHICPKLKSRTIRFINDHSPAICMTDGWKELLRRDKVGVLLGEVYCGMATKK